MKHTLTAFGPFITLRIEDPEQGPIILPDNVQRISNHGRVLSVGEHVHGLVVGDLVVFVGFAFQIDGVVVVKAENVLATVKEEES